VKKKWSSGLIKKIKKNGKWKDRNWKTIQIRKENGMKEMGKLTEKKISSC